MNKEVLFYVIAESQTRTFWKMLYRDKFGVSKSKMSLRQFLKVWFACPWVLPKMTFHGAQIHIKINA